MSISKIKYVYINIWGNYFIKLFMFIKLLNERVIKFLPHWLMNEWSMHN